MGDYLAILGSVFFLALGICAIVAGCFATYFGSGKSRGIGAGLIVLGVVFLLLLWYFMVYFGPTKDSWNLFILYDAIIAIVGALIGGAVAVGVFLLAIMKA
ncbi:MAG: hypothetical protein QMD21_03490 [Candidatus Thermoplasmatota archaeon]|nr:hypothetical protein [Candidatus Thermoplasmatota archaeon]MDI6887664.1 hypothetical protein [Candidatus Thermoplasmatota archaeon]